MRREELEGRFIALQYSYGSFWGEDEAEGNDLLTVWKVRNGELDMVYHPGEPFSHDNKRAIKYLKEHEIRIVYIPTWEALTKNSTFLDLETDNEDEGEHTDEEGASSDWRYYDTICEGEENWHLLRDGGLEIKLFDLDD